MVQLEGDLKSERIASSALRYYCCMFVNLSVDVAKTLLLPGSCGYVYTSSSKVWRRVGCSIVLCGRRRGWNRVTPKGKVVGRLFKWSLDPRVERYRCMFLIRVDLIQVLYEGLGDDPLYLVHTIVYSPISHSRNRVPHARDLFKTNRR